MIIEITTNKQMTLVNTLFIHDIQNNQHPVSFQFYATCIESKSSLWCLSHFKTAGICTCAMDHDKQVKINNP